MLSPSLPAQFMDSEDGMFTTKKTPRITLDDEVIEIDENSDVDPISLSQPASTPAATTIHRASVASDDEDLPLSMLSPTLPSIFDGNTGDNSNSSASSKLVQPIPKKPSDRTVLQLSSHEDSNHKSATAKKANKPADAKIRWINKINDAKRPRFLLRITFNSSNNYKNALDKSVEKVTGLGIIVNKSTDKMQKADKLKDEEKQRIKEEKFKEREREEKRQEREKKDRERREEESKQREKKEKERKEEELKQREKELKDKQRREEELKQKQKEKVKQEQKDIELKERHRREAEIERRLREKQPKKEQDDENEEPKEKKAADHKAQQLRRLNEDLLRSETEREHEIKRSKVKRSQSPVSLKDPMTQTQKEEAKTTLVNKKNYWLNMAREIDRRVDQTEDPLLRIVMQFDSLLIYMISYDYDEKLKLIANVLPSERYWNMTYQSLKSFINNIEGFYNSLEQHLRVRTYISFFIGLLYQERALILKRINSILKKVIDLYMAKTTGTGDVGAELHNKIIELQQKTIENFDEITENFASAQNFLSISPSVSINFPKTWYNRSSKVSPKHINDSSLIPGIDNYYLPIGIYTDLQEMNGLIYNCLREFIEIFLHENNTYRYKLKAGSKGEPVNDTSKAALTPSAPSTPSIPSAPSAPSAPSLHRGHYTKAGSKNPKFPNKRR